MKIYLNDLVRAGSSAILCSLLTLSSLGCSSDGEDGQPAPGGDGENPYASEPNAFEPAACKHKVPAGSKTHCGYLPVPMDHTNPESPLIKVYVTVFPALTPSEELPLIYLTGGPGTSTAGATALFEDTQQPLSALFRGSRDLIVLDQRGTNFAEPSLFCSKDLAASREEAYGAKLDGAMKLRLEKLKLCRERLAGDGIDLNAFDTYQSAADVRHLALALGHEKVRLFGASYGTRLTMTVMKLFPELIDTVVIDSILPPDVNPFLTQPEGASYALASLWSLAEEQFPDLEKDYYETIESLEANPVKVTVAHNINGAPTEIEVTVTAVEYVSYVAGALRATPIDPTLPATIVAMRQNGDFLPVAKSFLTTIDFLFPTGEGGDPDAMAIGMFESITGADDAHYTTVGDIENNLDHYLQTDAERAWGRLSFIDQSASLSGLWDVDPLPKDVLQPLVSDIPTLMLVGSFDSGSPLPFIQQAANHLSNHYLFEVLAGHAVCFHPCASTMLDDFLKDPTQEPKNTCPTDPAWESAGSAP